MSDATVCPDCAAFIGALHLPNCDVARCLVHGGQRLSCGEEHDCGCDRWTGRWPGDAECEEFGWWAVFSASSGWTRCSADTAGAQPDLNRLHTDAVWSPERARFVLP